MSVVSQCGKISVLLLLVGACGGGAEPRLPALAPPSLPAGLAAGATATFVATIRDPDRLVETVMWSLGDGNAALDARPARAGEDVVSTLRHTFAARGQYQVEVSVKVAGTTLTGSATAVVDGPDAGCVLHDYTVTAPDFYYAFAGVAGENPRITVCAGETFTFHLADVPSMHPFCIWNGGDATAPPGVDGNCATGTTDVRWTVPASLPAGARYLCAIHYFGNRFAER